MRPRVLLAALFVVAGLAGPAAAAHAAPIIGVGDNVNSTLLDPRLQSLGVTRMRVQVPYDDVIAEGPRLAALDTWFIRAIGLGIEPLVSFNKSYAHPHHLPSVAEYRRAFRAFRTRYPWVHLFSTWTEANFPADQPTGRHPVRTAALYRAARKECTRGRCTVLTADFRADGGRFSSRWLKTFKRNIGKGPHRWGLVSHPDVNAFSSTRTRQFLRATRGDVWVTEAGALNFFGSGAPPSLERQTAAMRYLMGPYLRVSRRIKRVYVYQWRAAPGNKVWDSGLLDLNGYPRPAFREFTAGLERLGLIPQRR